MTAAPSASGSVTAPPRGSSVSRSRPSSSPPMKPSCARPPGWSRCGAWSAALAARDRCREATGLAANMPEAPYRFFPDPVHQYLVTAGRTSFGGLRFGDLRRLALDIEVVTTEGYEFPSAAREGDRIVAIALADSTGFRQVLRGDRLDEPTLLAECGRIVRER